MRLNMKDKHFSRAIPVKLPAVEKNIKEGAYV